MLGGLGRGLRFRRRGILGRQGERRDGKVRVEFNQERVVGIADPGDEADALIGTEGGV